MSSCYCILSKPFGATADMKTIPCSLECDFANLACLAEKVVLRIKKVQYNLSIINEKTVYFELNELWINKPRVDQSLACGKTENPTKLTD